MNVKLIRKALDRREHEEFEVALHHKSKLRLYRELKWEVRPEEYLEFVKGAPSRLFYFILVPMGCLRSWVGMLTNMGHRSVLIVGLVRNQLSMLCLSVVHMISRDKFF